MTLRFVVLAAVLFSQQGMALDFPIQITEYLDAKKFVVLINESDIDEGPSWDSASGQPPLSMADALDVVRRTLDDDEGDIDAALTGIELKQIPHHPNHWHYLVKMKVSEGGEQAVAAYFVVLMNGKLMPALAMPERLR